MGVAVRHRSRRKPATRAKPNPRSSAISATSAALCEPPKRWT